MSNNTLAKRMYENLRHEQAEYYGYKYIPLEQIVDYTPLNNINISDNDLNNGPYDPLYNKIYDTFFNPLYDNLFNLLYIPLYNTILQRFNNLPNVIVYNTAPTYTQITLDPNSEIYKMYIQIQNQLFSQLYQELLEKLYTQLSNQING